MCGTRQEKTKSVRCLYISNDQQDAVIDGIERVRQAQEDERSEAATMGFNVSFFTIEWLGYTRRWIGRVVITYLFLKLNCIVSVKKL